MMTNKKETLVSLVFGLVGNYEDVGKLSNDEIAELVMELQAGLPINSVSAAVLEVAADKLRDPWTRIEEGRPETLPPDNGKDVLLTIHLTGINDYGDEYDEYHVIKARYWYNDVGWADEYLDPVEVELPDQTVTAVAWMPWPDPAALPKKEG